MWGRRTQSQKIIEEMGRNTAALLRAAQGPPPPPPTLGQRLAAWFFDSGLAEALGWVLRIAAAAMAFRFGWELFV